MSRHVSLSIRQHVVFMEIDIFCQGHHVLFFMFTSSAFFYAG